MIRILTKQSPLLKPQALLFGASRGFYRFKSSLPVLDDESSDSFSAEKRRLSHLRNVGILAHVDAGKTTVTERMLALAGVVHAPGSVDDGNTVTDYLPAERERGITIQSAAISFEWGWHNHYTGDDFETNDNAQIQLIDTPGHVDFSVEVNRSVAVLDGAVLVVDAVAGVQAQTETVWRAITRPTINNHSQNMPVLEHFHEPLPCLAFINKMDKEGRNFGAALVSLKVKLPGANPIPMQLPLFRAMNKTASSSKLLDSNVVALSIQQCLNRDDGNTGEFIGVVDLVHMRAILYPEVKTNDIEENTPNVIQLIDPKTHDPIDPNCLVTQLALSSRAELIAALANVDEAMEEYFLLEEEPTNAEIRAALRRATLERRVLPVMAGAALKGRGIEPLLDSIADLLPSPLDRQPPAITEISNTSERSTKKNAKKKRSSSEEDEKYGIGHPLHSSLLALAFKVVHMKGRGGSGDGRVVFARVYSGEISERDQIEVVSPPAPGEVVKSSRTERICGMLELAGGRFDNLEGGVCKSGDVCALVGLKSVKTGDTIMFPRKSKVYLSGVSSPKPVLKVRIEPETSSQQQMLSHALSLLAIEDPSLLVEETESDTHISGLGELHIEVVVDRLLREFGLDVIIGKPAVSYREMLTEKLETPGLLEFKRTIGNSQLQAELHLILEPNLNCASAESSCIMLSDPTFTIGPDARTFLGLDDDMDESEMLQHSDLAKALVLGCLGALKRGVLGSNPMANVHCHILNINAEGGCSALQAMPGALRAAAAHIIQETLMKNKDSCTILEPTMSVEVMVPNDMVGSVLSDLTSRRGTIGDVDIGNGDSHHSKALIRGDVPLVEILGYANALRSLTLGDGVFTSEYKGHSPRN
jgi:elongation factor G